LGEAFSAYPPSVLVSTAVRGWRLCWLQAALQAVPTSLSPGTLAAPRELTLQHLPPDVQAAAALYLGRKQRGVVPFWPAVLQRLTGYDAEKHPEVRGWHGAAGLCLVCKPLCHLCSCAPCPAPTPIHAPACHPCSCLRRCKSCSRPRSTEVPSARQYSPEQLPTSLAVPAILEDHPKPTFVCLHNLSINTHCVPNAHLQPLVQGALPTAALVTAPSWLPPGRLSCLKLGLGM
jgi:hypothetical protein